LQDGRILHKRKQTREPTIIASSFPMSRWAVQQFGDRLLARIADDALDPIPADAPGANFNREHLTIGAAAHRLTLHLSLKP
jgi:hypothetical protein